MSEETAFLSLIRTAAARRVLFLPHAVRQMSRPERLITTSEIQRVIAAGEIIEVGLTQEIWARGLKAGHILSSVAETQFNTGTQAIIQTFVPF